MFVKAKKGIAILLALMLVLCMMPAAAFAEDEKSAYDGDVLSFVKADGSAFGMWAPQEGSYWYIDGENIVIHIVPKNTATYGWLHWGTIDNARFKDKDDDLSGLKDYTLNPDGTMDLTLSATDYCGKLTAVSPIKKSFSKDSWTSAEQYYLAVPAASVYEAGKDAAAAADTKIEAIGEEITLGSADAIKQARDAYDSLTNAQKQLVKEYATLAAAEAKLRELKGEAAAAIEKFEYDGDTVTFIKNDEAHSAFGMFTPQDGTTYEFNGDNVIIHYVPKNTTTYNSLHLGTIYDEELTKDVVFNEDGTFDLELDADTYAGWGSPVSPIKVTYSKGSWTTAEQYYLAVPAASVYEAGKDAAAAVDTKIEAIGEEITLGSADAIKQARDAYDALSNAQKQLVKEYATLAAAEAKLKELKGEAAAAIEKFEYDGDTVTFIKNDEAHSAFGMFTPQGDTTCELNGDKVIIHYVPKNTTTYNSLHLGTIYDEELTKDVVFNEDGTFDLELDADTYAGWASPAAPIKVTYSKGSWTTAEQYYLAVPSKDSIQAAADAKAAAAVDEEIESIGEVTLTSGTAISGARDAYNALTDTQKALVKEENIKALEAAEAKLEELKQAASDAEAATAVDEKIESIGEVTLTSGTAISGARDAYNALTDTQKALVKEENVKALEAAEVKLEELKQAATDADVAAAMDAQIEKIGEVTLGSESAIQAARTAYNALTDAQKALVKEESIKALEAAKAKLEDLKKEAEEAEAAKKAAAAVDEKISAIGEVTLESEETITAARAAYDALTDEQKKLVTGLETLTAAETSLQELKDKEAAEEEPDTEEPSTEEPGEEPTGEEPTAETGPIELTITNNTNMFKVVSASLETAEDGSKTLVFALSGTGYRNVFKGTYEEAVANGADKTKWIAGAENADGKWEFRLPIKDGETNIPIVSISQSYLEKYEAGENPIDRAFYPRLIALNLSGKTLTSGDYFGSKQLEVTNNVKMFKVSAALLNTVGGPNSNNYSTSLALLMGSDSFDKAFIGRASEADSGDVEILKIVNKEVAFKLRWIGTAGKPETIESLMDEPIIISFHSVSKDAWYERQFTVDEDKLTLTIDEAPEEAPEATSVELTVTNNVNMFKVVSAFVDTAEDGTKTLVIALNGKGYENLFKGDYDKAKANGNDRTKWIKGELNADEKLEFKVPLEEGETYIPIVAISKTYVDKFDAGENPIERAFFPRQMELDLDAKTLVVSDYESSKDIEIVNNVKMFKPESAKLTTVGGPNSNGYATTLDLLYGSDAFDKAFIGSAADAAKEGAEVINAADRLFSFKLRWMETAGQPDSTVDLMKDTIVVSFHSVKNDAWYEREFIVSESKGKLTVNDVAKDDDSPVKVVSVKDSSGDPISAAKDEVEEKIKLTIPVAVKVNPDVDDPDSIEIKWQKDLVLPADTVFPVTVEFEYEDKTAVFFIYHYDTEKKVWEVVGEGKEGKAVVTFEKLSPVALVAVSTPNTGDASAPWIWGAAAVVFAAAAVYLGVRRRKEER